MNRMADIHSNQSTVLVMNHGKGGGCVLRYPKKFRLLFLNMENQKVYISKVAPTSTLLSKMYGPWGGGHDFHNLSSLILQVLLCKFGRD